MPMLDYEQMSLFFASIVGLALVPGIAISGLVFRTLQSGIMAGLDMMIGLLAARLTKLILVLCLFPSLQSLDRSVFDFLCVVGSGYLIFSAVRVLSKPMGLSDQFATNTTGENGHMFVRGFLLSWSNPKTVIFVSIVIPRFIPETSSSGGSSPIMPLMLLGILWLLINLIAETCYILTAARVRSKLVRFEPLMGPLMASILVALAYSLISESQMFL